MVTTTTLQEAVAALLSRCSERTRDILVRRFGLGGKKPETLQAIGDGYGITRERVRQVEADGLKVLRKHQADARAAIADLAGLWDQYGGFIGITQLRTLLQGAEGFGGAALASALVLLSVSDQFERRREDALFEERWVTSDNADRRARDAIVSLAQFFKQRGTTARWEELLKAAGGILSDRALGAVVEASKKIGHNVFGEYGLTAWAAVRPRGVRDKAFMVLARHGKPLHFGDIASKINEAGFAGRRAHTQTVHNELIRDDRFVLVGRGLYAVREWGYEPGTVADVVERTLERSRQPLSRDALVEAVLAQRHVQRNTVLLNLQNNRNVVRLDDGRYALRGAVEEA